MSGLSRRRRARLALGALGCLAVATALVAYAFHDGIQFFRTPSQIVEAPPAPHETFRLGGLVEPGSVLRLGSEVRFRVTDGSASVPVVFVGLTPDLFREGEGVIATGRLTGEAMRASEVLARHDEQYIPRELAGMDLP